MGMCSFGAVTMRTTVVTATTSPAIRMVVLVAVTMKPMTGKAPAKTVLAVAVVPTLRRVATPGMHISRCSLDPRNPRRRSTLTLAATSPTTDRSASTSMGPAARREGNATERAHSYFGISKQEQNPFQGQHNAKI